MVLLFTKLHDQSRSYDNFCGAQVKSNRLILAAGCC